MPHSRQADDHWGELLIFPVRQRPYNLWNPVDAPVALTEVMMMSTSYGIDGPAPLVEGKDRSARWIVPLAWAGIVGPILFTAGFLFQESFLADSYRPLAEMISASAAQPHGWVQNVNFIVFGLLTIAFAIGLHLGLRPTRTGLAGPALFLFTGVALLASAAFPLRADAAGEVYDPGGHFIAGASFFFGSALALVVVSRQLARDTKWRGLAAYTLAAGISAAIGAVVTVLSVIPDNAPLHEWAGMVQRVIILAILFPCRVVLSIRLWQVGRGRGGFAISRRGA